ncbi:MAG: DUF2252 family protein [Acidobacteria bacterium]|nr:DUF2252 family protein [Acidobacteriota bacterium]
MKQGFRIIILLFLLPFTSAGWYAGLPDTALSPVMKSRVTDPAATDLSPSLYVDPLAQDFSQNPPLLQRIIAGPHGYFRFINIIFSQEICRRFREELQTAPSFNLHGDAHLEQYAVTDLGRGLTDFDDSSVGPALLDLLRFGVSLQLACRAKGWDHEAGEMYAEFLRGYRHALEDPAIRAAEPDVAGRIRAAFERNPQKYYRWVDSLMQPLPEAEGTALATAMQPYVQVMHVGNPDLPEDYFRLVRAGRLLMGIGSAMDRKYLLRCRGESDDPLDDVVLEVKEVRNIGGISCLTRFQNADPFRILVGQARIAYQPFHHLGYFRFQGLTFWVHSWVENYREVNIESSFQTPEQLRQVAYDIGVQLGCGHPKQIADPLDLQLRHAQLRWLKQHEGLIRRAGDELANEVTTCWERFCRRVEEEKERLPLPPHWQAPVGRSGENDSY